MTLQQLRFAITVAETGSMNKASESLYISQPTLTNTIKSLEEESGIKIFNRTNKGVVLTPEGSDFIFYAKRVFEQFEQFLKMKVRAKLYNIYIITLFSSSHTQTVQLF